MSVPKTFVKEARLKAKLTQTKLAAILGVSQAFISKWEKENTVPLDREAAWKEAVGLGQGASLDDLQIVGDTQSVEAWLNFISWFIENRAEGGGEALLTEMEMRGGLSVVFGPLIEHGFKLPNLPKINVDGSFYNDEDFDQNDEDLTYDNEEDEYFFDEVFNEFLLWHANYCDALSAILDASQMCFDDYVELTASATEYVWALIFTKYADLNRFTWDGDALSALEKTIEEIEKRIAETWFNAYKKAAISGADEEIIPPMWKAPALIESASSDISAMLDFDFHKQILHGRPVDPWIEELLSMTLSLHKKVNDLSARLARLEQR